LEQVDVLLMQSAPRQVLASTFVRVNLVLQEMGLNVLPLTFVKTTTVAVTLMQTVNRLGPTQKSALARMAFLEMEEYAAKPTPVRRTQAVMQMQIVQ
jgi:hypothetical protein